jgi:1-deoxy-D-xylulose-5-phosphate synthase
VPEHDVGVGLLGRKVRAGDGSVALLAIGRLVVPATKAAAALAEQGIDVTVWDVRCCAPLDPAMIADAAAHGAVVTCEDGVREGGIGMSIADAVHALDPSVTVTPLGIPTRFIPQGKVNQLLSGLGLDADGIAASVRRAVGR